MSELLWSKSIMQAAFPHCTWSRLHCCTGHCKLFFLQDFILTQSSWMLLCVTTGEKWLNLSFSDDVATEIQK